MPIVVELIVVSMGHILNGWCGHKKLVWDAKKDIVVRDTKQDYIGIPNRKRFPLIHSSRTPNCKFNMIVR